MPPVGDEQRRHETAARFETLRLQPPPPPTAPTLNNNNLVPVSMDYPALGNVVLAEILLRLLAKCVIRFKSVCKSWLSLISSDQFCLRHTLRQHKLQPSLLLESYNGPEFFYFNPTLTINTFAIKLVPYIPTLPHHRIHQGCNGLLLLKSKIDMSYDSTKESHKRSFSVYNPTTRQSREITLAYNDEYPSVVAIFLAFDPSNSPYYKIVCIRCKEEECYLEAYGEYGEAHIYQGEVYDSESHTWKLGLETFTSKYHATRLDSKGVYWNNGIYWRIGSIEDNGASYRNCYCYFDIENNRFKTTSSYSPLQYPQKSRNACPIYCNKLVDKDEDEDEDDPKKHYHVIGKETGTIVKFVDGEDNGDGDGACGLLTCRVWTEKHPAKNLNKYYENLINLGSSWYYQAEVYPFGEILALV